MILNIINIVLLLLNWNWASLSFRNDIENILNIVELNELFVACQITGKDVKNKNRDMTNNFLSKHVAHVFLYYVSPLRVAWTTSASLLSVSLAPPSCHKRPCSRRQHWRGRLILKWKVIQHLSLQQWNEILKLIKTILH